MGVWAGSVGIYTFSAVSRCLGREIRPAATEFSTFSANFRYLGRDFRPAATGNLYLFPAKMAVWVEISHKQARESLPFSADFRYLGRDLHPAATGFSTLFGCFSLFG